MDISSTPTSPTPRSQRLCSIAQAAAYFGVNDRTIRNYISNGYFPAYRRQGVRGVLVDIDEAEKALERLAATGVVRTGFGSFGPKAKIVNLPSRPVVVPRADQ